MKASLYPIIDAENVAYALCLDDNADVSRYLLDEVSSQTLGITTQTDNYTLVIGDAGRIVEMNKATAVNLTVPPNASVAFPVNTRIDLAQYGGGQVTVVPGAAVTIRSSGGKLKLTGQYSAASLYKRATNEWVLIGDIAS